MFILASVQLRHKQLVALRSNGKIAGNSLHQHADMSVTLQVRAALHWVQLIWVIILLLNHGERRITILWIYKKH
ncbi:putative orphan protein [Pseudoalteromonas translucida]|uniref:Orphan protein n=1 Tax=Pseudoalteromonas translucida (strain TAC 125) TaxID=326442 RepID=Q3IFQ7_PSET1|nr:putative orphan protein [Pseudoalteromonas translucida]